MVESKHHGELSASPTSSGPVSELNSFLHLFLVLFYLGGWTERGKEGLETEFLSVPLAILELYLYTKSASNLEICLLLVPR